MEERGLVFVTGGHGFVGSFVVKELLRRGYRVRCLVRKSSVTKRIDGLDVEKVIGDILDPASLAEGAKGARYTIHLAGISSYKDMQEPFTVPTIVDGSRNVMDAAFAAGAERVVLIGSGIVFGSRSEAVKNEESPFELEDSGLLYAIGKHRQRLLMEEYVAAGKNVNMAIPMETYGPEDDEFLTTGYLKEAITGWPALATDGGTCFGHVEDVALGVVLTLEKGGVGQRYILGSENRRIKDIIALALDVAGKKKPIIVLPTGITRFLLRTLWNLGLPTPEHPNAVDYGTLLAFTSSEKAKRELGWEPRTGREVMESTVGWLRSAGHIK